jgi:hypothetical protein
MLEGFPVDIFPMKVRVLYHDHCFDGAASAALFTQFYTDKFNTGAEFAYTGMAHTADQLFSDTLFDGEENAIVDFKYSPHPKLTWWFDHHQSAFLSAQDADHYKERTGKHFFFDPTYRSCTQFIADTVRQQFGYQNQSMVDLIRWADIIDGAQYKSAEEAVGLGAAAMKLTLVIEGSQGSGTVQKIIGMMRHQSLDQIIADPEIEQVFRPLYERHLRSLDLIRRKAVTKDGVIFFDLVEDGIEGYNKFIPYYLFPQGTYTVSVSVSSFRTKVSVGSSPWAPKPVLHNLATICERYGGGGHPKVGAISFPIGAVEQARKAAAEIVEELNS